MFRTMFAGIVLACLLSAPTIAGTILFVNDDVDTLGDAILSGSTIWPGQVEIQLSDDLSTANVVFTLTSTFSMTRDELDGLLFSGDDAEISLTMPPLTDLTPETVGEIVSADFQWGPQPLQDADPATKFLTVSGAAVPVSEPSGLALIAIGAVVAGAVVARSWRT